MLARKEFYFIRHGQTDWNKENRIMGWSNIPLNELGAQQAKFAIPALKKLGIKTICYSPLIRAQQTATIINQTLNAKMVLVEDLQECNFGALEGLVKEWDSFIPDWKNDRPPPGGEICSNFIKRVAKAVNYSLSLDEKVLLVSHGAVYWALGFLLQLEETLLGNCLPIHIHPCPREDKIWRQTFLD
jgi:probable phosphoglycerate mutase